MYDAIKRMVLTTNKKLFNKKVKIFISQLYTMYERIETIPSFYGFGLKQDEKDFKLDLIKKEDLSNLDKLYSDYYLYENKQ